MENNEQHILQKHLSRFLIEDVFNVVSHEDVLKVISLNVWQYQGKQLQEGEVKLLKAQAGQFRESKLWKILKDELVYLAHQKGYVKSQTESDQIAGKMMEYITNVIDTRLKQMIDN